MRQAWVREARAFPAGSPGTPAGAERRTGGVARSLLRLAVALLALAAPPARVLAEGEGAVDPALAKLSELEAAVAQHVRAKAEDQLVAAAKAAVAIHKEVLKQPELTKRVIAAMEACLKGVQVPGNRIRVIDLLAQTGDPQIARLIKPLLRPPNPKDADPVHLAAIAAAAKVPVADYVDPLLTMVDESKNMAVASASMTALGSFRTVKSKRVRILQALVKTVEKTRPGVRPGRPDEDLDPARSDPTNRWQALSPVLPSALNALTGQTISTADEWFQVVRQARDLNGLFASE